MDIQKSYDFTGKVAAVTGGAGVLGGEMSCALAELGCQVAVLDRVAQLPEWIQARAAKAKGQLELFSTDVLNRQALLETEQAVEARFGPVTHLINAAGGNRPTATTGKDLPFFDLPEDALRFVFDLNLLGTLLTSQMFGRCMAAQKSGVILNVSSMNAFRPLTRIPAYSAAKAGVSNFTQWLAVYMAQEYGGDIRVNAIAPGFFLTEQNRFLLTDKDSGALTARGTSIIQHTPMGRFGTPEDLIGTVLWLLSPASSFITGVVVPIDGGFSAFSGV